MKTRLYIRKKLLKRALDVDAPDVILAHAAEMFLTSYYRGATRMIFALTRNKLLDIYHDYIHPQSIASRLYFFWSDVVGRTVMREDGRHAAWCALDVDDEKHNPFCVQQSVPRRLRRVIGCVLE